MVTGTLTQLDWRGLPLRGGKWALNVMRDEGSTYRHATFKTREAAVMAAARYGIQLVPDHTRAEQAERFASALRSTTDRYLAGCMTRPTWRDHMRSLWSQIEHAGLRTDVMRLVDPLAQSVRR